MPLQDLEDADLTNSALRQTFFAACPTTAVASICPGPESYSSRLWTVDTDEGLLMLRVPGRSRDPDKLRSTIVASRLAAEAGVPAPRYRAFLPQSALGRPVLIQEFISGERAADTARDAKQVSDLAATLGRWVGCLHEIRRVGFGDVLCQKRTFSWSDYVRERVSALLRTLPQDALPVDVNKVWRTFDKLLYGLNLSEASLNHGDLYLDNILTRSGEAICLLDFEHASFQDRFADFGKLSELLFEQWPGAKSTFFNSYHQSFPPEPGDRRRLRIAQGLYELTQLCYFARWQPDLVHNYVDRLVAWTTSEPSSR